MSCQKIPQKNSVLCWVIGNPSIGIIVITVGQFSAFLGMIFCRFKLLLFVLKYSLEEFKQTIPNMAIVGDEEVFQSLLFLLGNLEHEDFFSFVECKYATIITIEAAYRGANPKGLHIKK